MRDSVELSELKKKMSAGTTGGFTAASDTRDFAKEYPRRRRALPPEMRVQRCFIQFSENVRWIVLAFEFLRHCGQEKPSEHGKTHPIPALQGNQFAAYGRASSQG
jgi:hypothetical protein